MTTEHNRRTTDLLSAEILQLRFALSKFTWQPIEKAPKDTMVIVYSPPTIHDWPDTINIDFDYIDSDIADDYWYNHGEHYEHYCCVALPEGSIGPKQQAPYTHWMPMLTPPTPKGG